MINEYYINGYKLNDKIYYKNIKYEIINLNHNTVSLFRSKPNREWLHNIPYSKIKTINIQQLQLDI